MKNTTSRRSFLKKSLIGTGIAFTGTLNSQTIEKNFIPNGEKTSENLKEGIFPFYKFVEDFNFGEYIPKDQGGKFIQMELIGSEKDEKIVEILKGNLVEKNMGTPPDWSIFEKTELEKSVWFNRFYYLPSLARLYYLNKNEDHLKFMMDFLKLWIKDNPVEGPSKSKYNWFDMQVAWRSINLSWCYYLSKEGLTDDDKKIIYDLQADHARILMKDFGKKELNEFNHQSHGALAILYLAILFPSLPEAPELLKTGLKIIKHHVENAFYNDGGNIEQMFGYYPFMASVIRDSYLLIKANNVGEYEYIVPLLKKMYVYLKAIAQPDNTVPPINDSYEETILFIVPTLASIIGYENLPVNPHTELFKDSRIAVIRSEINSNNKWYINANAAKLIGSHAHAGRLAINVWFNEKPILVDSGCCNYDNPFLVNWYRTSEAHNTVIIDEKSDFATSQKEVQWAGKRYTDNIIEEFIIDRNYKFLRMVSPQSDETNSGVKWIRDIILVFDNYLFIHDYFEAKGEHSYKTIFRLSDVQVEKDNNKLRIASNPDLTIFPLDKYHLEIEKKYFGSHGKDILTPTALYSHTAKGSNHSTFLFKEHEDDFNVSQKVTEKGIELFLKYRNDVKLTLLNYSTENKDMFKLEYL